ncbi:RNA polymerase sigma factor (sigma-70 family) [Promicromonospora sp. AC04]|uniref:RNA polymerase sigma factor n=1 Tax=Promicromonospora sp. AC04 TaxID=2135723 RepID=UPI000D3527CC|nr:sigma-70 family RNA polymerase sigma factor [Promicromonospora sp. AC04]PUB24040.1 RNA polymerase sigma factor (sigma-70 family) [Promicromonospora sp. AC04]
MALWEAELTELATSRGGALVGYAYSLTRDKSQAEDLVQDALVKVYSRLRRPPSVGEQSQHDLDRPEPNNNAEGYVRRAILTIYLDGYRRRNHWAGLKHLLADDADSPGADRVATARVDVGVALKQLSPRQREAVMLRFFDDLTVPQIAAALGTSQGNIKRHLFDATAVLRQALAEVSVPAMETDLDERLDTMSGAVRRRRTAKVAAVSGASLVLAGLLAFAVWGPGRLLSEPVPPATPSPDAAVGAAWAPEAWRSQGPQYHCGMEVTELVSSSDTVRLELTGDVGPADTPSADGGLAAPVRITRTDAEGPALDGGQPRLVFARDGQVVDLGRGWHENGYTLPGAGQSADDVADATAATACGRWTTYAGVREDWEQYVDPRPAGTYDVYAVMPWEDDAGTSRIAVSEPVTMEVPAVEMSAADPLTVDIRDGYQPPWLEGTSLACGAYASDIPGGPQLASERSGLRLSAEATGESGDLADKVTVTFTETEGEAVDATRTPVTLVWLSNGKVVAVGSDVWSDPAEDLRVEANGTASVELPIEPDRTCLQDPDAGMPRGNHENYDVYALTELDPGSGGERQFVSVGASSTYVIWG